MTDIDREWALAQCPPWAARDGHELGEAGREVLVWDRFVTDQAERFERFFAHEMKPAEDWSRLWRRSWWPKADPAKLYPSLVPRDANPHPVFRRGSDEYERALEVCTPLERKIFSDLGFAQFRPDDKRVSRIIAKQPKLTPTSQRMMGDLK